MGLAWVPGNALGCNVNSHRSGWDGQICHGAATWNCGATPDFRNSYCERGDGRCYHLNLFQEEDPSLVIDDHGVGWLLEPNVQALDDQVLLLWGHQFAEPVGVRDASGQKAVVFGAYRIRRVEPITSHYRTIWRIVPYPDSWTSFHQLQIERPRYQSLGGPYIKQVDRSAVQRLFRKVAEEAESGPTSWGEPHQVARFEHFSGHLEEWLDAAQEKSPPMDTDSGRGIPARRTAVPGMLHKPFKDLKGNVTTAPRVEREPATGPDDAPASEASAPASAAAKPTVRVSAIRVDPLGPIIERAREEEIAELYGKRTLSAIQVASLTNPLVVLRGNPGVGKSTLAHMLLDDPKGERTLTVPVASTWRGREDLLGYVNPLSHEFEPTEFTSFLNGAANAWDQGDRANRVVVFEEFNLAQPEFWLSDVLVRTQFPAEDRRERTIDLGGHRVRNWVGSATGVYLPPSVRFVATVNTDHTTQLLSPRVLDRAGIVELSIEPREAVALVGLELTEDQLDAIADLDFHARNKAATFSLRTARSLRACIEHMDDLGFDDAWEVVDLILAQEVLSKVRLLAGDPLDARICESLSQWSEPLGKRLPRCAQTISLWKEMLQEGRDVAQA